jgi:hypothetical protein
MFGINKKKDEPVLPGPPVEMPNIGYKNPVYNPYRKQTPSFAMSMKYNIPEAVIEEIMAETITTFSPTSQSASLSSEDYIELYKLSSSFKSNIWNFIKNHAMNKQLDKLQNAMQDLEKMDIITAKLSKMVPLNIRQELDNARE